MIITEYSLVEICKICSGKRLPKGCDFSEVPTAYKYIRARDIKNGTIDGSGLAYISEEVQSKIKKYIVNTNDIVITIVGASVGDVAYVTSEFDGMNLTENAVRLTEFAPYVNSKYLMYILNSSEYWILMQQIAGGAAQPKLGIYKIEAIKVQLPPKAVQDRIVDILHVYDDLIENNQKQIKLLEEAAQRLYKEWFVDLRFPGYENTPVVDGVPEGWSLTNINAVMTFHRGYDLTKNSMIPGKYPVIGSTSIIGYHNQYKIKGPGIVTGRSGSLGEYQLIWEDYWPHNTALYVSDMKGHHVLYLYSMLQTVDFSGLNNGGAIPTLNRNTLSNIAVIEAPKALQDEYVRIVEPLYSSIRTAKKQIKYLQETRDRLLPKLMNGEIEV